METDDGESNVLLASMSPDGTVTQPVRVNGKDGDAMPHLQAPAQVAVGAGSEVYVVWHNSKPRPGESFPGSDLRFARSLDGGESFEPTLTVNDDVDGPVTSHLFHEYVSGRGWQCDRLLDRRQEERRGCGGGEDQ